MEQQMIFRTSAMGFHKKEVLQYIDDLKATSQKQLIELQEKVDGLEKQNQQAAEKLASCEENLAKAEEKNQRDSRKLLEKNQQIDQLNAEVDELKKQIDNKDREIQIQIERNRQLQFRVESLEYKSRKYDESSSQIGQAIIQAQNSADKILADAKAEVKGIYQNNEHIVEELGQNFTDFKQEIHSLVDQIRSAISSMEHKIGSIEGSVQNAVDRAAEFKKTYAEKCQNASEEPSEAPVSEPEAAASDEFFR